LCTSPTAVLDSHAYFWKHPSSPTMSLVLTQSLTDMSTRELPGDKVRPAGA
jgi:hypothetical protein